MVQAIELKRLTVRDTMQETYKKYTIEIIQDSDPMSPREWDNLGTMYCFHKRYNLGDKHSLSIEEAQEIEHDTNYISLPIYMYDHSGITVSTSPFSCHWDSGKLGIIAVSRDKLKAEGLSDKTDDEIRQYLTNEITTYDQFITGDVYGFKISDKHGDEVESCWGFFGSDTALTEAKSVVDWLYNKTPQQLELNLL